MSDIDIVAAVTEDGEVTLEITYFVKTDCPLPTYMFDMRHATYIQPVNEEIYSKGEHHKEDAEEGETGIG